MTQRLPKSALEYLLQGLIPYSRANTKLAFKPGLFFNDLEKIARAKQRTLKNAYYQAQKDGLIELDDENIPRLTPRGLRQTRRFDAKYLGKQARLMVIFDIPEEYKWKRQHLRRVLHELRFKQIQKSVWASEFDHKELILSEVAEYGLQKYVQIYEAVQI